MIWKIIQILFLLAGQSLVCYTAVFSVVIVTTLKTAV